MNHNSKESILSSKCLDLYCGSLVIATNKDISIFLFLKSEGGYIRLFEYLSQVMI